MNLYGRGPLLSDLSQRLDAVRRSGRGQLLAVQGRRQVGKSTVITAFVEASAVPYVYLTAVKRAPAGHQLAALARATSEARVPFPDAEVLFGAAPATWTEALNRIALVARGGPVIVVIDEFPWAVEQSATLEGELQVAWDTRLEHLPVLFVLVGSDLAMMERLNDHDRPLFGRAQPLVVPPLNPAEIAQALPDAVAIEVFDAHLITGGYPRLVRSCVAAGSPREYVRQALGSDTSDLVVTARLTLAAEFPDSPAAASVLRAIGAQAVAVPTFNDVVAGMSDAADNAARTALTRALTVLTRTKRMVEIEVPAGSPASSKLRRYVITDPYLRFWFAFVQEEVDNIARGRADLALARFERSWESWRGVAVEPVVRESVWRLASSHPRLQGVESVGAWWNRRGDVEVDLVARDRQGVTAIGTVKWRGAKPITSGEVRELMAVRTRLGADEQALLIGVCPAGARTSELDLVFDAGDLLSAWSA